MEKRYREPTGESERHDAPNAGNSPAGTGPWTRRQVVRALGGLVVAGGLGSRPRSASGAESVDPGGGELPALPRMPLLEFRDRQGRSRSVRDRGDWQQRRNSIRSAFESVAGKFPGREKRCPLGVEVHSEEDCGSYVRQDLTYQSEPEGRVPAYLLVPKTALAGKRAPGALCLHQTHAAGRKVVVGLGNSPDDEYAVELVRRGFVCLAPAYPLLADYAPDVLGLGHASGTMKAVWDNVRGLDLLESLSFVRNGRFVAIGHSLGGHNAIYTAVWDPRVRVIVTSCAFDAYVHYMGGNISGWIQLRYLPAFESFRGRPAEIPFDFHELIATLAPRALFANAPKADSNFRWRSVAMIEKAVKPVYRLWGAEERLQVRHPDVGHRFPPELRQEAYRFIDHHLTS